VADTHHRECTAPGPIPQTERQGPFLWQGSAAPAAGVRRGIGRLASAKNGQVILLG
jgi:hypothetical protein